MGQVVDTLLTVYKMDDSPYVKGAKSVVQATQNMGVMGGTVGTAITAGLSDPIVLATEIIIGFAVAIPVATVALGALEVAAINAALPFMQSAASFESLKLALTSFTGSAKQTEIELARLKEVAKAPGLGYREAVEGSIRLQAIGFSARLAERAMLGFGNALARSGGGKAELDRINVQIAQIVGKGKIMSEDIRAIAESFPGITQIIAKAFGTTDFEKLSQTVGVNGFVMGLIDELERLPKVADSAQIRMENLADAWDRLYISIGSVFNMQLSGAITELADYISFLADSGAIKRLAENIGKIFGFDTDTSSLLGVADGFVNAMIMGSYIVRGTLDEVKRDLNLLLAVAEQIPYFGNYVAAAHDAFEYLVRQGGGAIDAFNAAGMGTGGQTAFEEWKKHGIKIDPNDKGSLNAAATATATNTKKLVELQEKALDLQKALMGGGLFAGTSFNTTNVSRMVNPHASRLERGIRQTAFAITDSFGETLANQNRMGF